MDYLLALGELKSKDKLRLIALTYARAKCETLMQVLEFIARARKEGLDLIHVENAIADWLSEADSIYRDLVCEEELFKFVMNMAFLRVRKAKELRARA